MLYRPFGKTGEELSILGFGAMRLPVMDGDVAKIDEEKAIPMIRAAIDRGVNYLDTAWSYHGENSEALCAKVMKDGYRDKVNIATKLPSWLVKTRSDMDHYLNAQLERLEEEQIDFYLLHTISAAYWDIYKKEDYKSFLDDAKRDGKIKYAGFSFHDNIELFKEIVDDYDWDFCQIQLNYLDENYQAGLEGMRYAASKGLGVIIMEPLRGGMLARTEIPEDLQSIWNQSDVKRSPAEWALRYLWDYKEVGVILSGMTTMEQMEENIRTASEAAPSSLSETEQTIIARAKDFFHSKIRVDCTNCRYCLPCPQGVYIPEIFWAHNHDAFFGDFDKAKFWTTGFLKKEQRASNCNSCGRCEKLCPQGIPIRKHLAHVVERYEKAAD
ncbi:MAG: aldo/keto reductase [Spirochaetales bacterium]|nr:aldo/keto reductase [Spirochaetales bacterium]